MKKTTIALCIATALFSCNSENKTTAATEEAKADSAVTASKETPKAWVPVDSATAMKMMMDMGTPGDQHKMLAKANGNWSAETTMWSSPDAPPVKGKGTASNKMVLGDRYQQTSFKGDFMGMPYEGSGVTGYDKAKKVYFTTWMDNWSTMIMNMEGNWDEATKSINFKGKMLCPANNMECEMREVFKMVDDNTQIMEMYGPDMKTGKEYKNMEIKFTRSK